MCVRVLETSKGDREEVVNNNKNGTLYIGLCALVDSIGATNYAFTVFLCRVAVILAPDECARAKYKHKLCCVSRGERTLHRESNELSGER